MTVMGLHADVEDAKQGTKHLTERKLGIGADITRIISGIMTIKERIMREAGRILNDIFIKIASSIEPGLSLRLIDDKVERLLKSNKAKSGLKLQGFPANIAISLNEEVIQGVPDSRVISEGDLLSLDMTLYYQGFFVDKAISLTVDPSHYSKRYLVTAVKKCFDTAISYLDNDIKKAGQANACYIGKVIAEQAKALGISTTSKLAGHGIGEKPHMEPIIPNTYIPKLNGVIEPNMFITIEPIVFYAKAANVEFDKCTVRSNYISAHWEDTLIVSNNGVEVIT